MGLIKSKEEKAFERKQAIRSTVSAMEKQISKLTEAEKKFFSLAKEAKLAGIENQYQLALSGLRATMGQKKRVMEMKLNFEIMNQTRDMLAITGDFLAGMGSLSKDMIKLCDEKQFEAVSKAFRKAMRSTQAQESRMEGFLDESKDQFEDLSRSGDAATSFVSDEEFDAMIKRDLLGGDATIEDEDFAKRIAALKDKEGS